MFKHSRTDVGLTLSLLLICAIAILSQPILAQPTPAQPVPAQPAASVDHVVPSLVKYAGTLSGTDGKLLTGTQGLTFLLYKEESGGAPLWMETQNVQADKNGHYSVLLGAANGQGLPADVFMTGEARWLAVQLSGQAEQARTVLLSVPYALKAGDAETLGGKPASAFMAAAGSGGSGQGGQESPQAAYNIVCASATACKTGFFPAFSSTGGAASVTDSIVSQSGSTVKIAGSETATGTISAGTLSASSNVNAANVNATGNVSASTVTTVALSGGVNGTMTGTGNGVGAIQGSATATGAAGFTFGVIGQSDSDLGRGVFGLAPGAQGVGVIGETTGSSGIGVVGKTLNGEGLAFAATGSAQQDRTSGGWIKAMVFYSGFNGGRIVSCFNSTLYGAAATTAPCGFAATRVGTGDYILDLGFEIDDRFFSATNTNWFATIGLCTDWNGACSSGSWTPNQVEVFSYMPDPYNQYTDSKFYLTVY